ncbi:MAG: cytochrome bc complex cytochrome b subunit [Actinomycetota bacterium]|nr:cytochrome bc complex cytochrome b subunit [Actinomycetota bacterium]
MGDELRDPTGARVEPLTSDQGGPGEGERPTELERLGRWFDERTGFAAWTRTALRKVFPDHWSFLLGEVALFCFVILVATGTYLAFFFVPDARPTHYDGPYAPLRGAEVSAAFDSVMRISFEVRAGLVMRQVHHWAALVFVASIVLHLSRVFFTGAFRRPRELNWLIGFTLLTLAMAMGFTGYSLPDDLLSGTGMRIAYSAAISIPFIGPWFASLIFGGEFPTAEIISRLFVFHIFLLPLLMFGLIGAHLGLLWLQKHTQYKGEGATEQNVVGRHFWPGQVFRSAGLFFLTAAVLALLGGLVQINPVWLYGPFIPYVVSSPAQPDWYIGWLEGALRIAPPFEPTIPVVNITIPTSFLPGVVVPGVLFTIVALWPFIEARVSRDGREHHLLDWPWEAPGRTATGVAILAFFGVLTLAGANDILAATFNVRVELITDIFRFLAVALPIVLWLLTYRLCRERAAVTAAPMREHRGIALRRTAAGGFEEVEEA